MVSSIEPGSRASTLIGCLACAALLALWLGAVMLSDRPAKGAIATAAPVLAAYYIDNPDEYEMLVARVNAWRTSRGESTLHLRPDAENAYVCLFREKYGSTEPCPD